MLILRPHFPSVHRFQSHYPVLTKLDDSTIGFTDGKMLHVAPLSHSPSLFSPPAGDGVLWRRVHHRSGEEHQRQHTERGLDCLHLPWDPQGQSALLALRSQFLGSLTENYNGQTEASMFDSVFFAGFSSPARSSRHPPWHQGTKRAADWKCWSQTGYVFIFFWIELWF